MRRFLSRFSPRYTRSLVYMLQASEYRIPDFYAWYGRVKDFRTVEHRKHIEWTIKTKGLFISAWIFSAACIVVSIFLLVKLPLAYGVVSAFVLMLVNAYALPHVLVWGVFLLQKVQAPYEAHVMQQVATILAEHPATKIAVAGSYGKTSTREIVKTVLSEARKVAAPRDSFNTPLGIKRFVDSLQGDEQVLVFEFGEYYSGDVRKLAEVVRPDIGIITGVNEAHLEKFGTIEATTACIFELADFLGNKTTYVNAENDQSRLAARQGHILYSRKGVGEWTVEKLETGLEGTSFVLRKGAMEIPVRSKLLGFHMAGPIALAAHIAFENGLSVEQIKSGLAHTRAVEHRLDPHTDSAGVVTLDDSYNGNPDGVAAIIEFLKSLKSRRVYVTPGLVEIGPRKEIVHRIIGKQLAEAGIEHVILIRNSVTPYIEKGLKEGNFQGELTWFDDALQAYKALPHMTVSGDIVVLQNDWPDQYA